VTGPASPRRSPPHSRNRDPGAGLGVAKWRIGAPLDHRRPRRRNANLLCANLAIAVFIGLVANTLFGRGRSTARARRWHGGIRDPLALAHQTPSAPRLVWRASIRRWLGRLAARAPWRMDLNPRLGPVGGELRAMEPYFLSGRCATLVDRTLAGMFESTLPRCYLRTRWAQVAKVREAHIECDVLCPG
jgi:hypothetical protein